MTKISKDLCLVITMIFALMVSAQSKEDEGLFNRYTGLQLSHNEWMQLIPEHYELFEVEKPLEITFETDFRRLIRDKSKDNYQKALLHFSIADSLVLKRFIQVKPRGNNRRQRCLKPPLKLKFTQTEVYVKGMDQLEKMKMVYECKQSLHYEQYILKEYLIYKMFNLFTDLSFRVRLLKLNYIDTGRKKNKTSSGYAFLIEETQSLANRNDLFEVKVKTANKRNIEDKIMAKVSMFQYLIGNADWSVTGLHNIKTFTFKSKSSIKAVAVPYDFDYAGLVDASYAVPSEESLISSVKERVFMDNCHNNDIYLELIQEFKNKKVEIYNLINDFKPLTEKSKEGVTKYLDEFYRQIAKENAVAYFLRNCDK